MYDYTMIIGEHEYNLLTSKGLSIIKKSAKNAYFIDNAQSGTLSTAKTFVFRQKRERDNCLVRTLKRLCAIWDRPGHCPLVLEN